MPFAALGGGRENNRSSRVDRLCTLGEEEARRFVEEHARAIELLVDGVSCSNVDAIHGMRVASRRIRAALAEFEGNFEPGPWQALRERARSITRGLGRARELDVTEGLLSGLTPELDNDAGNAAAKMGGWLHRQRSEISVEVQRVVTGLDERALERCLMQLLESATPAERCYTERGARRLGRLLKRVDKYHRKWRATLVEEHLHAVRIQFKKLRYTCEIYEDAYGKKMKPVLKSLKGTQRALGSWNDMRILNGYVEAFGRENGTEALAPLEHEVDRRTLEHLDEVKELCDSFFSKDELNRLARVFKSPSRACCDTRAAGMGRDSFEETDNRKRG